MRVPRQRSRVTELLTELDLLNVVEVPRRAWHGIDQLEVTGPDPLIPRKRRLWQAVSSR
jgi:hypothetical protein